MYSLPPQTGFTFDHETAFNFPAEYTTMNAWHLAQNELYEATRQSCTGWYWMSLPYFLVGLTLRVCAFVLTHCCNRGQQGRPSLIHEIRHPKSKVLYGKIIATSAIVICLFVMTGLAILRKRTQGPE